MLSDTATTILNDLHESQTFNPCKTFKMHLKPNGHSFLLHIALAKRVEACEDISSKHNLIRLLRYSSNLD